ncbi:hypothetical protein ATSB10_28450 [Dyella thiooxydans]|uniref:Uncharacterized protein n=1 Tax=Dyella thiooxydans TaxID=445710 RepID=A0A169GW66_9GAMM|nr:hypothetical protein ATSB10_28450 [Dyella thiooxydans]
MYRTSPSHAEAQWSCRRPTDHPPTVAGAAPAWLRVDARRTGFPFHPLDTPWGHPKRRRL